MVNKVILVGNVGIDPEVRTLEGGAKVARVRLATTERLYDRASNETKEHTEWHTITLWRGLADVVDRYVRKGTQIYVEGRLRTREWMDKDNNKRYTTEIMADVMNLLGRRSDNPASDSGTVRSSRPRLTEDNLLRAVSSSLRRSNPRRRPFRRTIPTTCRSEGFGKNGLSNQSRKSKITPARVYSDRGEIVKIRLVRQPFSCHSIMCRTVLLPARITRVRRKVPDLVG
jgi:single-strand DNA-binding protein